MKRTMGAGPARHGREPLPVLEDGAAGIVESATLTVAPDARFGRQLDQNGRLSRLEAYACGGVMIALPARVTIEAADGTSSYPAVRLAAGARDGATRRWDSSPDMIETTVGLALSWLGEHRRPAADAWKEGKA